MYLDMLTYVLIALSVIAFIIYITSYLTRSKSRQESLTYPGLLEEIKKEGVSSVACNELKQRTIYSLLLNNNLYVRIEFDAENRYYEFEYKECIRTVEGHMNVIRARTMLYELIADDTLKRTKTYTGSEMKVTQ